MIIAHNNDLLTSIFIWLPAKSLIRFKLVCKNWFSLISSDYFSHRHTLHHRHHRPNPEPSLLLRRLSEKSDFFYLHFNHHSSKLVPFDFSPPLIEPIVSSFSNGLCLLQCRNFNHPVEECLIYNPTTKQSKMIMLNVNERYISVMGLNLVFDPQKSSHYKIICVRSVRRRRPPGFLGGWWRLCQIEMYDSQTSNWSLCGEPFWAPSDLDFYHGVHLNCSIHWHGMFFNLQNSLVGQHPQIVVPGGNRIEKVNDKFVESYGYLDCIKHFQERNSIMVFELERDYSEWSLKYLIDLSGVSGALSLLGMIRGEGEEDSMLVLHGPGKITGYKLQEKCNEVIVEFREAEFYEESCVQFVSDHVFQFVETLTPVL